MTITRVFDRVYIPRQKATQRFHLLSDALAEAEKSLTPAQELALSRGWKHHTPGPILDQGQEGACTGFAAAGVVNCGPRTHKPSLTNTQARGLYKLAQRFDEWPGDAYEGSSVDGTALALRSLGRITKFEWARDIETGVRAVLIKGPTMLGVDWTSGMMGADADGFIRATGDVVGGHAIAWVGVNRKAEYRRPQSSAMLKGWAKLQQSWGVSRGRRGFVFIPLEDLARLIAGIDYPGEVCSIEETRATIVL
ncbi:MAG TPA: hypothetical protein VNM92_13865 [Thermoanaerobaculia bacterium]|nr:hypothetical protein [Thermoanaerobaculia bacterium]